MIQRISFILILSLFMTACGGAAATPQTLIVEPAAATEAPVESTVTEISPTLEPTQTFTPAPTFTPSVTPTETSLPPLELPTEAVNAPAKMVWDGAPTYLGDSQPGYAFRVTYDSNLWVVTSDQFGFPALAQRDIQYCVITGATGRGMPANITMEHDVLYTDNITFDVGIAYENGTKKFVTYTGGDGKIITGFQVSFQDQADTCLADAVTVLSTLKSVPVSQTTPQP